MRTRFEDVFSMFIVCKFGNTEWQHISLLLDVASFNNFCCNNAHLSHRGSAPSVIVTVK